MYRDSQQAEIDFLVQTEGKTLAIECKWSEIPNPGDLFAFTELVAFLKKTVPLS